MSDEKKFPTADEMAAKLREVREKLAGMTVHKKFIIEDYPIGGANRGNCALESEYKKGSGFRTVKTTTNKNGRWCAPKKSTYRNSVLVVVSGEGISRNAAWLDIGFKGIYLQSANGDIEVLVEAPSYFQPSRERRKIGTISGEPTYEEAGDPALCDSWDVWKPAAQELIEQYLATYKKLLGEEIEDLAKQREALKREIDQVEARS